MFRAFVIVLLIAILAVTLEASAPDNAELVARQSGPYVVNGGFNSPARPSWTFLYDQDRGNVRRAQYQGNYVLKFTPKCDENSFSQVIEVLGTNVIRNVKPGNRYVLSFDFLFSEDFDYVHGAPNGNSRNLIAQYYSEKQGEGARFKQAKYTKTAEGGQFYTWTAPFTQPDDTALTITVRMYFCYENGYQFSGDFFVLDNFRVTPA